MPIRTCQCIVLATRLILYMIERNFRKNLYCNHSLSVTATKINLSLVSPSIFPFKSTNVLSLWDTISKKSTVFINIPKQPDTLEEFFQPTELAATRKVWFLTQIQGAFTLVSESVVLVGNDMHFFQVMSCGKKLRAYNSVLKTNLKCIRWIRWSRQC